MSIETTQHRGRKESTIHHQRGQRRGVRPGTLESHVAQGKATKALSNTPAHCQAIEAFPPKKLQNRLERLPRGGGGAKATGPQASGDHLMPSNGVRTRHLGRDVADHRANERTGYRQRSSTHRCHRSNGLKEIGAGEPYSNRRPPDLGAGGLQSIHRRPLGRPTGAGANSEASGEREGANACGEEVGVADKGEIKVGEVGADLE